MDTNIAMIVVCAVCVGAVLGVLVVGLAQHYSDRGGA